jgi:two-component system, OmpR family, response regulator
MTEGKDFDFIAEMEGVTQLEPEISDESAQAYSNAALIGGEKLRDQGFFLNVVRTSSRSVEHAGAVRVLIVEDDPGTSGVIAGVLGNQGFETTVSATKQEVLRALGQNAPPDLILLDVMLPDANGFAILERLRRHPDLSEVPVIMLTSLSEPADVAKGLALGATGYMSKPAQPQALVTAIRHVLAMD